MICAEVKAKTAVRQGFCLSELQEVAKAITGRMGLPDDQPPRRGTMDNMLAEIISGNTIWADMQPGSFRTTIFHAARRR
jgi:hypothetical protein